MHFTKMEGLGNDYVYVNCFEEKVKDPASLAVYISDRHLGIGSDGLILIGPSDKADFSMAVYNSDGSCAEMCGNGIRCVGKYVYDNHLIGRRDITIETPAGIKKLRYLSGDKEESRIMVDMGTPRLGCGGVSLTQDIRFSEMMESIDVLGNDISFVRVSMGNPHAVIWCEELDMVNVEDIGSAVEKHRKFESGTNVEFVKVVSSQEICMRVWERGSGETKACGTGACAAVAACIAAHYTSNNVVVHLDGGALQVGYDGNKDTMCMVGSARRVFDGRIDI